jgi:transcriptional regulator with XRE-family HTH domain
MPKEGVTDFKRKFLARTRELRDLRGLTQDEMATALDVSPSAYRKYETRTMLPHPYIERFAILVGRDVFYVITGKSNTRGRRPAPLPPTPSIKAPRSGPRRRKASLPLPNQMLSRSNRSG